MTRCESDLWLQFLQFPLFTGVPRKTVSVVSTKEFVASSGISKWIRFAFAEHSVAWSTCQLSVGRRERHGLRDTPPVKIVLDWDSDQIVSALHQINSSHRNSAHCAWIVRPFVIGRGGRGGAEWRWVDFEWGARRVDTGVGLEDCLLAPVPSYRALV